MATCDDDTRTDQQSAERISVAASVVIRGMAPNMTTGGPSTRRSVLVAIRAIADSSDDTDAALERLEEESADLPEALGALSGFGIMVRATERGRASDVFAAQIAAAADKLSLEQLRAVCAGASAACRPHRC